MNIIGLIGYKGSGKDEVCKIIQKHDSSWENKKFAGKLKQIATLLTGIDDWEDRSKRNDIIETLGMPRRSFLQKLGTEAVRDNIHADVWVNALFADYKILTIYHPGYVPPVPPSEYWPNWIITDCRFPNEAEIIKEKGGIIVEVHRFDDNKDLHPSETALDNWEADYSIDNTGDLDNLNKEVENFLQAYNLW